MDRGDQALFHCPPLADALATCPRLAKIHIKQYTGDSEGMSESTANFLRSLHAPLRELELHPVLDMPGHVLDVLVNFKDTLEVFRGHIVKLGDWNGDKAICFQRLHTLELESADVKGELAERVFPNLRVLKIDNSSDSESRSEQANTYHEYTVWRHISRLEGSIRGLRMLSLKGCRVNHFKCELDSSHDTRALAQVLHNTQPSYLSITLHTASANQLRIVLAVVPDLRILDITEVWPNSDPAEELLHILVSERIPYLYSNHPNTCVSL